MVRASGNEAKEFMSKKSPTKILSKPMSKLIALGIDKSVVTADGQVKRGYEALNPEDYIKNGQKA
jgi:hypothetical protein